MEQQLSIPGSGSSAAQPAPKADNKYKCVLHLSRIYQKVEPRSFDLALKDCYEEAKEGGYKDLAIKINGFREKYHQLSDKDFKTAVESDLPEVRRLVEEAKPVIIEKKELTEAEKYMQCVRHLSNTFTKVKHLTERPASFNNELRERHKEAKKLGYDDLAQTIKEFRDKYQTVSDTFFNVNVKSDLGTIEMLIQGIKRAREEEPVQALLPSPQQVEEALAPLEPVEKKRRQVEKGEGFSDTISEIEDKSTREVTSSDKRKLTIIFNKAEKEGDNSTIQRIKQVREKHNITSPGSKKTKAQQPKQKRGRQTQIEPESPARTERSVKQKLESATVVRLTPEVQLQAHRREQERKHIDEKREVAQARQKELEKKHIDEQLGEAYEWGTDTVEQGAAVINWIYERIPKLTFAAIEPHLRHLPKVVAAFVAFNITTLLSSADAADALGYGVKLLLCAVASNSVAGRFFYAPYSAPQPPAALPAVTPPTKPEAERPGKIHGMPDLKK